MRLHRLGSFYPTGSLWSSSPPIGCAAGAGSCARPPRIGTRQKGIPPTPRIEGLPGQTKMLSGMNAETIQLGASTISLILRSAATLHTM